MVAERDIANLRTDRLDYTRTLMPKHSRVRHGWKISVTAVQVRVAHARRHDTNPHFVGARVGQLKSLDHEGRRPLAHYCRSDPHVDCRPVSLPCEASQVSL